MTPGAISARRPGNDTRCCLAALALLIFLAPACAKSPPRVSVPALTPLQSLALDLASATRLPGVQRGSWGVVVHSLDRDERLFDLNSASLFVPASAAKLVSLATAADAVGWDYRYETTLRATGPVVDGTLRGDLVVVGSGDPSIGGRAGDGLQPWVEGLRAAGIRRIDGRIIGDDSAVEEPRPQLAWAWDDLGYTYGSIFGALNLNENRMTVTVTPGQTAGGAVALYVEPEARQRPLANRAVTGAPGSMQLLWPEQRPGEPYLTIAGSIPLGAAPATLSVAVGNPTIWFAAVFRNLLQRSGIEVTGEAYDVDDLHPAPDISGTVIYTHRSRPLSEIARPLLKNSINLYAEAALRLNVPRGVPATNDAALDAFRPRLAAWGVAPGGHQLIDGSGLSRRNVVSPEALLVVLRRMHDATGTSPFMQALPVAGIDGTLSGRMKGTRAEGNVRAKTGSMSNIRSLAGYVTTADGERMAFAILVNNFEGSGGEAEQAIDTIVVRLATFSRVTSVQ